MMFAIQVRGEPVHEPQICESHAHMSTISYARLVQFGNTMTKHGLNALTVDECIDTLKHFLEIGRHDDFPNLTQEDKTILESLYVYLTSMCENPRLSCEDTQVERLIQIRIKIAEPPADRRNAMGVYGDADNGIPVPTVYELTQLQQARLEFTDQLTQ